ncbi:hypothetical protein BH09PSE5_BH09PSE5_38210 [soil metagenome]
MKMKQIEVTIMGQSYLLGCPPGGDVALLEAVNTVDREMTAIKEAGRVKARERIAVLAALNLAYALAGRSADSEVALASGAVPPVAASFRTDAGSTSEGSAATIPSAADDEAITALLRRLDHAIGSDERLL